MKKLRLGVIGAGSWAVASHFPEFDKLRDEIEFMGVSRKGAELLEKIKADWGFEMSSEDYRDVLDAGIDICLVASPAGAHYEHARDALNAGAHVLLEKPMTIKSEDAWDLVDIAAKLDRHLLLSFGWNYVPMMSSAKALMDDPGVGQIEQISIQMGSVTRDLLFGTGGYPDASRESPPESRTWTDPRLSGGGYAMAQLTHALGCALWLTELRGKEVFAFMSAPEGAPVEFYDAVSLRFTNGAIGTMSGGATHAGAGNDKSQLNLRVIGDEGQFHIDFEREDLWLYRGKDSDLRPTLVPDAGLYNCVGPPNALVDLALGRTDQNLSPGWLGARTVEILEACYRSAAERTIAEIEDRYRD